MSPVAMATAAPPPFGALALATLGLTLFALWMDRRRGIGPASFLPWDFLMMGGALVTLILTVLFLRGWLAG